MDLLTHFNPSVRAKKQLAAAFKEHSRTANAAYLGEVSSHEVNQHLVRGFTTSNTHKDTNHSVGHFLHHDYILLSREDGEQRYLIAEVDLHVLQPFSHFFIIPNDLPERLFGEVLKRHTHHRHTPFAPDDGYLPEFKHRYSIFTRPEHFAQSLRYVTQEAAKCIAEVKQPFLFEIHDTSLFVYNYANQPITERTLDMQMRFACTVATLLEQQNRA